MIFLRFPGGLSKVLTFSYDDGVEQDAELMRILNEHGMKGTFNLNSGCFAKEGTVYPAGHVHRRMTERAAKALYANSGHEVAVHCLTHPFLPELTRGEQVREVILDRENLERMFGGIVTGMAYPFGAFDDDTVSALRTCGIRYARTVVSTHSFALPKDWLRLEATCHHDDPALMSLADRFLTEPVKYASRMFYLWGHAYEFEQHDNWQVIRAFADRMAGRPDVWYATNIEICDYVEGWKRIIASADGRVLHNPTATTYYFEYEQKVYVIHSGETLHL